MSKPAYVHLHEAKGPLPLGASHWWGYPDLPEDVDIPTVEEDGVEFGLTLICQINLKDLPEDVTELPHEGLLLFFADISYYCGDWDEPAIGMQPSNAKVARVIYIPGDRMNELEDRSAQYVDADEIPAAPITLDHKRPGGDEPDNQLLGETEHLEWETWPDPCEGWRLLLQMDSCEADGYTYNFVDWGVLCFIVSPGDLQKLDFSNVRALILST